MLNTHKAYEEYLYMTNYFNDNITYKKWLEQEWKAHTYKILQQKDFIKALIEELIVENKKLKEHEEILKEIINTNWGIPGGYKDCDTERMYYDIELERSVGVRFSCTYCLACWHDNEPESHEAYCPIKRAKELLNE